MTILKAFFDSSAKLKNVYQLGDKGLERLPYLKNKLSVAGELNKLAENISIGRNWAGVHYYSDYYESLLLGEKVAIGILEEQKLTYFENFFMTLPKFDGTTIRI